MIASRILSSRATSLIVIIVIAALMPGVARAGNVFNAYTLTPFTINGFQTTTHDFTLDAKQFNPALGVLKSIDVDWLVKVQATATQTSGQTVGNGFQSNAGGPISFNGTSHSNLGFSAFGSSTELNQPFTISNSGQTVSHLTSGNIAPASFLGAIGTGTVPLTFSDVAMTLQGSSFLSDVSSTTSCAVTVTYNYDSPGAAVPLPAALQASLPLLAALLLFRLVNPAKRFAVARLA